MQSQHFSSNRFTCRDVSQDPDMAAGPWPANSKIEQAGCKLIASCPHTGAEASKDAGKAGTPSRQQGSPPAHSDEEGQLVDMNTEAPGQVPSGTARLCTWCCRTWMAPCTGCSCHVMLLQLLALPGVGTAYGSCLCCVDISWWTLLFSALQSAQTWPHGRLDVCQASSGC